MNFATAFEKLLGHEGGYANHPADPGGETMWGVTKKVAVENGYTGDMKSMPQSVAMAIYKSKYWDAVQAENLPADLRYIVFDAAVNSGAVQAAKWLQRACGAKDDGVIGPQTIKAANALSTDGIKRKMLAQRLRFMATLSNWPAFSRGWANRIADLLEV
jgi:lysozyme family protein